MPVKALLVRRLFALHHLRVSLVPNIVADAHDLPGDFDIGFVGLDAEGDSQLVTENLAGDNGLSKLADGGQLVMKVAFVQRKEIIGQGYNGVALDRKSTRLNSSHRCISYAVFC